jgi:hypothetical protein
MKQSQIRKVVFVTEAKILDETTHYLDLIEAYKGQVLSTHPCDEGFVALIYFPNEEMVYMPSTLDEAGCVD